MDKNPRDIAGITPFQLASNKEVKFRDVITGATGAMSLKLLIAHYLNIFVGFENLSSLDQIDLSEFIMGSQNYILLHMKLAFLPQLL